MKRALERCAHLRSLSPIATILPGPTVTTKRKLTFFDDAIPTGQPPAGEAEMLAMLQLLQSWLVGQSYTINTRSEVVSRQIMAFEELVVRAHEHAHSAVLQDTHLGKLKDAVEIMEVDVRRYALQWVLLINVECVALQLDILNSRLGSVLDLFENVRLVALQQQQQQQQQGTVVAE
jgi:hypothetical protein